MILTPVEIELVLLFQKNYLYPKNKDEFFDCINILDENMLNREKVLCKAHRVFYNIRDYFASYSLEQIDNVIKNII